jgi:hypothetical protein
MSRRALVHHRWTPQVEAFFQELERHDATLKCVERYYSTQELG